MEDQPGGASDMRSIPAAQQSPRAVQRRSSLLAGASASAVTRRAVPLSERSPAVRERYARVMVAQMLAPTTPVAVRDEREQDLMRLGAPALGPLREALLSEERFYLRLRLVRIAASIGGAEALALLHQACAEDPHDSVRRMAWAELGRLGVDIPPPASPPNPVAAAPAGANIAPPEQPSSQMAVDSDLPASDERVPALIANGASAAPAPELVGAGADRAGALTQSAPDALDSAASATVLAAGAPADATAAPDDAAHLAEEADIPIWERDTLPVSAVLVRRLVTNPRLAVVAARMFEEQRDGAAPETTDDAAGPADGQPNGSRPRRRFLRWLLAHLRRRSHAAVADKGAAPVSIAGKG